MKRFSHYLHEDSHSFKDWVDPWGGLPPDVRKRVHRLTRAIFKAVPGSPKQRELQAERDGLLRKHGVWAGRKAKRRDS